MVRESLPRRMYAKLGFNVAARSEILYNNCCWYSAPRCLLSPQAKFANILVRLNASDKWKVESG